MRKTSTELRDQFRSLHDEGCFLIPNPFDVGSARILQHLGFPALATTSSGLAATFGRPDQRVTRDELVVHVAAVCAAVDIPVNVDAEGCFHDDPGSIERTIDLLAEAGASGISFEDFDLASGTILPEDEATERVRRAALACQRHGVVLTARAEQLLYGSTDLNGTIDRLRAYRNAGAEVLYSPGPTEIETIRRIVDQVGGPVNVLALPGIPPIADLAAVGARRVSTGGSMAWAAYGGLVAAATELRDHGTTNYLAAGAPRGLRAAAFSS
jgi:2-methylisocitrate lyase-like PEP mutase family enzyme